jgi:Uma2 family endonuclease
MATVVNPPEQRVTLDGISWDTYERLLDERGEGGGTRFAYDEGTLEIMTTSFRHEKLKHAIDLLVVLIANEMRIPIQAGGSTTFKRKDLAKGFEPDACFYIQHVQRVRGLDQIDLTKDPPPDLVIEIDITTSSLNKFRIYSGLGVPEVWRYSGEALTIFKLEGKTYVEKKESCVLPEVTAQVLTEFVHGSPDIELHELMRRVQDWARK